MLTGEAYFEVAHNKNMPFHVISKGQTVEVLGTHFNINAYNDEKDIKTTLLEGSVRVSAEGGTALLTPGEQAQIAKTGTAGKNITVIQNANTDEAVAWKNGFFQFENADIQTIMRQFAQSVSQTQFAITQYPTTVLIGPDGKIIGRYGDNGKTEADRDKQLAAIFKN
jgi:transmembrane sensor